ncbi:4569_t:CDS:1, partial [Cetraspora pellucida]
PLVELLLENIASVILQNNISSSYALTHNILKQSSDIKISNNISLLSGLLAE